MSSRKVLRSQQADGDVTFLPKPDATPPRAPIPELPTTLLFAVGLLMLAGYVRVGRRK